jgi:glycosyltransferase involved in cell wall biosynthesis
VLLISPTQTGIGGIAQHVKGLSSFLKKKGHKVDILSSENTLTIPIKGLKNPSFMISAFLKTKLKKGNDIVHAHNLPSALPMRNASGKKILTLHGIYSEQVDMLHGKTTAKISGSFEKDALAWADAITVISKEAFDHYTRLGFKVRHVPNAIEIDSLPQEKQRMYNKQIVFAGRLSKEKGILDLLAAAQKLPQEVHLVVLGSGPEEEKVKQAAVQIPNVHYMGYQSKETTIQIIRGSDILIQPSLVEGISSTILEAMACKTPIVATSVGGNKEILQNDRTSLLVTPGDSQLFHDKIMELLSDKQKSDRISEEAFREVQRYDWSNVGNLYLNIYEELLQK